MRRVGLLPGRKEETFFGFTSGDLNKHFVELLASHLEQINDVMDTILTPIKECLSFISISMSDAVILMVFLAGLS